MAQFKVGDSVVRRIEETLRPGYTPEFMFRGFDASMLERNPITAGPNFMEKSTGRYRPASIPG